MPIPTSALSPSSLSYLGFVLVVLIIYYLLAPKAQTVILWAASLLLCAAWNPSFALVVLASTLLNYFFALAIRRGGRAQRRWLYAGIVLNLLALFVFKYLSPGAALTGQLLNTIRPRSRFDRIRHPAAHRHLVLHAAGGLVSARRLPRPGDRQP